MTGRMVGRPLCSDEEAWWRGFRGEDYALRRRVLRETLAAFEAAEPEDRYQRLACDNLRRWRDERRSPPEELHIEVLPLDWGEAALDVTRRFGACFAVLNMANAFVPGGAYVEGAPAQEENMFRRTDCHFRIGDDEYDRERDCYRPFMTDLLSARHGRVYLDTQRPRVCLRGREDRSRSDLGYRWLAEDEVFPFYELRAAAVDRRDGRPFDPAEMGRRIGAQLDTLRAEGIRHALLGAFGCGAFRNPAAEVARLYRREIASRADSFSVIAFAIHAPGYGPDNYSPFAQAFSRPLTR